MPILCQFFFSNQIFLLRAAVYPELILGTLEVKQVYILAGTPVHLRLGFSGIMTYTYIQPEDMNP